MTVELQAGNHLLNSQLLASNVNCFSMRATTEATVTYNQQLQIPDYVSDISSVGYRISLSSVTNQHF